MTTVLADYLPKPSNPMTPRNSKCKTCNGAGFIYRERPIFIGKRFYGNLEDMVDCPDCLRKTVHCEVCEDYGIVRYDLPTDHPDFGKLRPCTVCPKGAEMAQVIEQSLVRQSGLPEFYKRLTFGSWNQLPADVRVGKELAYAAAILYAATWNAGFSVYLADIYAQAAVTFDKEDRPCNSLVFQGEVGTGKTGLAAAIVNYLLRDTSVRPMYVRCRDLIAAVQSRFGKDDYPSSDDVLKEIKSTSMLVIDEMNLTQPTPNKQDILEEVIRYRHSNALPTIITLNANRDAFEQEWGIRTATVAWEMAHWITLTAPQIRNEGAPISTPTPIVTSR